MDLPPFPPQQIKKPLGPPPLPQSSELEDMNCWDPPAPPRPKSRDTKLLGPLLEFCSSPFPKDTTNGGPCPPYTQN